MFLNCTLTHTEEDEVEHLHRKPELIHFTSATRFFLCNHKKVYFSLSIDVSHAMVRFCVLANFYFCMKLWYKFPLIYHIQYWFSFSFFFSHFQSVYSCFRPSDRWWYTIKERKRERDEKFINGKWNFNINFHIFYFMRFLFCLFYLVCFLCGFYYYVWTWFAKIDFHLVPVTRLSNKRLLTPRQPG